MIDQPATVVALLVRVPVPGRVKTRLAAGVGDEAACRLYRAMVTDILGQIRASGLPLVLLHDGRDGQGLPASWQAGAVRVRPQPDGDIGRRMAAAFAECFAAGIERVLLAGSDLPDLTAAVLAEAGAALACHDAVLAPTADGGYGLIGLKRGRYRPELFADIPWSTDQVLAVTLQRAGQCALSVGLLPMLRDIDTMADLLAYGRHPCATALATNRTMAQLLAPTDPA